MNHTKERIALVALRAILAGLEAFGVRTRLRRFGLAIYEPTGATPGTIGVHPYRVHGKTFWRVAVDVFSVRVGEAVLVPARRGVELTCCAAELMTLAVWVPTLIVARVAERADPEDPLPIRWSGEHLPEPRMSSDYGWTCEADTQCSAARAAC